MRTLFKRLGFSMPKTRKQQPKFIDVIGEYIDKYASENQLNPLTKEHYEQRKRNIHLFLASKQLIDINIDEVRIKHMEDLRSWLFIALKTCSRRHASLHIELCKRSVKYAVMMEYTGENWIEPVKSQRDKPKDIIHLTSAEVIRLMNHQFRSDIYRMVAKIFAFQCFTGLSYCELFTFDIVELNDRQWINSKRDKTGKSEYVYLFDEAKQILDAFGGQIPKIPNQTCNRILKEIAGELGINKTLTTHVGRKTHATLLDEYGVDAGTIARQLRNTERVCYESYIAKSHKRTETALSRLGLNGNMLLPV